MSVCMSAVSAGISEVLIKYTGKYVNIYFIMKITYFQVFIKNQKTRRSVNYDSASVKAYPGPQQTLVRITSLLSVALFCLHSSLAAIFL